MTFECTGVILAGGKNRRFPGRKKAFRRIGNEMILDRITRVFSRLFSEVIIVVNEPGEFAGLDMMVVTDIDPSRCALSGLHAGLFYASNPHIYVTACDTPFVIEPVIRHIVEKIHPEFDVVLPRTDMGVEPLSAVYSKKCLPAIEKNLSKKQYMIKRCFKPKKVREIPVKQLKQFDPDLKFIFNINTPEDFDTARKMAGEARSEESGAESPDKTIDDTNRSQKGNFQK